MEVIITERWMVAIWVIVMFSATLKVDAQPAPVSDSAWVSQLLQELEAEQLQQDSGRFHKGMFYGYKTSAGHPQRTTPDENIYFTGIIAFTLQYLQPYLSAANRQRANTIIQQAVQAYPYYQNKRGQPTYFFWQDGKPIMPHSYIARHFSDAVATSEDVDDSIILLMTQNAPAHLTNELKKIMDSVANGRRKWITNTLKKYSHYPAHTTYLGKNMRVDFDFAVHCNILYFLKETGLPFNTYDSATAQLVATMVANREYERHPTYVAPYYVQPSVLLYHLARLMGTFKIDELEPYRQQVINDMKAQFAATNNIMERIILATSLLRMGQQPPVFPLTPQLFKNSNQQQFVFYQARAGSQMGNPLKGIFLHLSWLTYHFFCPAYNKTLLLEYLVLLQHNRGER